VWLRGALVCPDGLSVAQSELVVVDSDDWWVHKQIRYLAADTCLKYDLNLSPRVWSTSLGPKG